MAAATDQQMQNYADQRVRVRAEQVRALVLGLAADKAAIDDIYARAVSNNAWADARVDGPPHLLHSGNSASPDDMLNFNSWATAFLNLLNGASVANASTVAADAATLASAWPVLQRACVRPVQG